MIITCTKPVGDFVRRIKAKEPDFRIGGIKTAVVSDEEIRITFIGEGGENDPRATDFECLEELYDHFQPAQPTPSDGSAKKPARKR